MLIFYITFSIHIIRLVLGRVENWKLSPLDQNNINGLTCKNNGLPHQGTPVIDTYEWKISKSNVYVKDCNLKRCKQTWGHGRGRVKERVACMHCVCALVCTWWHWCSAASQGDSTFCKWQRQRWWSHVDSVWPAVRLLFNTILFLLFGSNPTASLSNTPTAADGVKGETTIKSPSLMRQYENDYIFLLFIFQ